MSKIVNGCNLCPVYATNTEQMALQRAYNGLANGVIVSEFA